MNDADFNAPAVEMKTILLEWNERKHASVQVPKTYDPNQHFGELAILVGQIDSDDIADEERTILTWQAADDGRGAAVLVELDPDLALYTAQLIPNNGDRNAPPLREWPVPARAAQILAEATEFLGDSGDFVQDNAQARCNGRFAIIRPGQHAAACWLVITQAR
ncbi:Uncharacterised protein [Mycobacteroides abscessus subsp. abscessus]|uniref:hypothetical protein n=1 Tax=Mycobacteroides abscessus TaxID=36809 RepID=UPI0009A6256A|nr:hypothetical protein [Mycobacteroides abscessus]SLI00940.1 Uncharacterised protein [Mycobacteroides abscessus subsp. abscessus]